MSKSTVLISGGEVSNELSYTSKIDVSNSLRTSILINYLGNGSGISYAIRGYVCSMLNIPYSVESGFITSSGDKALVYLGPTNTGYEQLDIGTVNISSGFAGKVTVISLTKRR